MGNSKRCFIFTITAVLGVLLIGAIFYFSKPGKVGESSMPTVLTHPAPNPEPASAGAVPVVKNGAKIKTLDPVWARAMESPNPSAPSIGLYIIAQKLTDAVGGKPYSAFISASGDPAKSFEWKILSGTLPPGITSSHSIDCSMVKTTTCRPSLQFSGTPQAAGSYSFRAAVSDGTKAIYKDFTLVVKVAPNLKITTTVLPDAFIVENYTAEIAGSGGETGYSWSIRSGSLPPGLSITSVACNNVVVCRMPAVITGRAGAKGTFTFGVVLTSGEETFLKELSITVK